MKFFKNQKKQEEYFLLPSIKIQSYPYDWNPQKNKIITKEHLSFFLEKVFQKNFLSYKGAWYTFYLDERCYTPLTDELIIHNGAMISYLTDKESLFEKEDEWPCIVFFLDSSDVYKNFSHLISEENFSLLLRDILFKLEIFPGWEHDKIIDFFFISNKENLEKIERENVVWVPEDEKLWAYFLKEEEEKLITSKMDSFFEPRGADIELQIPLEEYLKK